MNKKKIVFKSSMATKYETKNQPQQLQLGTIIEGSVDGTIIEAAAREYTDGLIQLFFPPDLASHTKAIGIDLSRLQPVFKDKAELAARDVTGIILEINGRTKMQQSDQYHALNRKDKTLHRTEHKIPHINGRIACVDKGVVFEAVAGVNGILGRTLAGDIDITYNQFRKRFTAEPTVLKKRMIHTSREGSKFVVETLIEHTGCGRRAQMMTNDQGHGDVPSVSYVFNHLDALGQEFKTGENETRDTLEVIKRLWDTYESTGTGKKTPDGGLWAGIILKIAQRQALSNIPGTTIVAPIQLYDKYNGNIYVGMDSQEALTDATVIQVGGYTRDALDDLAKRNIIFSLKHSWLEISETLSEKTQIREGSKSYNDLQKDWLTTQSSLVDIVEQLWKIYRNQDDDKSHVISQVVEAYLRKSLAQIKEIPLGSDDLIRASLTHDLFHAIAYNYLLGTLVNQTGNPPGMAHIEDHLAVGDHELGAKEHLALGLGDIETPNAMEMFTGYSVLLHSTPGKEAKPIILMIKLDTDRSGTKTLTTEETRVAMANFQEVLKLWPYILAGDLVPMIVVRGKNSQGVSRMPLSINLTFGDVVDMLGSVRYGNEKPYLPDLVPANNSAGEVVLVPSMDILKIAIESGSDLKKFREEVPKLADRLSSPEVQKRLQL